MRIFTRNIAVNSKPGGDQTTLTFPLRGGFEIDRSGRCGRYGGQHAHMHNLDRALDLSSSGFSVLVVNVDNSVLTSTATKLSCGEQESWIGGHRRISLTSGSGARVWHSVHSLWSTVQKAHSIPVSPLAIGKQQADVVDAILQAGVDQGSELVQVGQRRSRTGLSRVEDWITANLTRPISRADLCEVAGLPARALTRAFAINHGRGPLQFVRDRRLDAIQRILLGSHAEETTVTQVAMDMGIFHLGRFSADYKSAFGERPSETLSK